MNIIIFVLIYTGFLNICLNFRDEELYAFDTSQIIILMLAIIFTMF